MTAIWPPLQCSFGTWLFEVAQCYELLATDSVGRVVYTQGALQAVTPVNYILDGQHVVFRTAKA